MGGLDDDLKDSAARHITFGFQLWWSPTVRSGDMYISPWLWFRNAGYLQKYTGIQSHAVVAGVDVLPDAQALIHQGDAQLYRIRPGDLQPE